MIKYKSPYAVSLRHPEMRNMDPRNAEHVERVLSDIRKMSDVGVEEVAKQVQALPAYARKWYGTQRIVKELESRLHREVA